MRNLLEQLQDKGISNANECFNDGDALEKDLTADTLSNFAGIQFPDELQNNGDIPKNLSIQIR